VKLTKPHKETTRGRERRERERERERERMFIVCRVKSQKEEKKREKKSRIAITKNLMVKFTDLTVVWLGFRVSQGWVEG
jgi:hypothetical protein